jgi:hypothetical protein
LTIQDILHIADEFQVYGTTHSTDQGAHAASLAEILATTRTNADALKLLSNELEMLQHARELSQSRSAGNFTSALQSVASFFNSATHKAKYLYATDNIPAHQKSYQPTVVDGNYEAIVTKSIATLRRKP